MGHPQASQLASNFSASQCREIRQQVDRICNSPPFTLSQRYPALLRYVVEQTLSGRSEQLKERTIGVEAFHRGGDYDTSADPAVRIAATEVRKRLAQYYYEPGREQELRIELPVGSYVPSFRFPENVAKGSEPPTVSPQMVPPGGKRSAWWGIGIGALGLVALVFSPYLFKLSNNTRPAPNAVSSSLDQFWEQIVQTNGSVQLCIGLWPEEPWRQTGTGLTTGISDYEEIRKIADLLESHKKRYLNQVRVIGPGPSKLSGLLDGPVIYVGPYEAIAPLMAQWRFSLDKEIDKQTGARRLWVRDRESTYDKRWHTELITLPQRSEGYAIITRVSAGDVRRPFVIVNGSDSNARVGAVELLTNRVNSKALFGNAPKNWQDMNFQAVIETRAENKDQVSSKVLVTHFWK
jgi:hypothetical protein